MPRRSRARRTAPFAHLQAKLDAAVARTGCRKLIHVVIASDQPPSVIAGCPECEATLEQWKTLPKPPRPTATTFDADAEEEFA